TPNTKHHKSSNDQAPKTRATVGAESATRRWRTAGTGEGSLILGFGVSLLCGVWCLELVTTVELGARDHHNAHPPQPPLSFPRSSRRVARRGCRQRGADRRAGGRRFGSADPARPRA